MNLSQGKNPLRTHLAQINFLQDENLTQNFYTFTVREIHVLTMCTPLEPLLRGPLNPLLYYSIILKAPETLNSIILKALKPLNTRISVGPSHATSRMLIRLNLVVQWHSPKKTRLSYGCKISTIGSTKGMVNYVNRENTRGSQIGCSVTMI